MRINLSFVPPGGGETDYSLQFEMPSIPQAGDYISIHRGGTTGTENFVVKRTWWELSVNQDGTNGTVSDVWVECEFAEWSLSSEDHKKAVGRYEGRTGKRISFDESMY